MYPKRDSNSHDRSHRFLRPTRLPLRHRGIDHITQAFYSQLRGIVSNLAHLTAVWVPEDMIGSPAWNRTTNNSLEVSSYIHLTTGPINVMAVRFVSYPHFYCVSLVSISYLASVPSLITKSLHCTWGGNRTRTDVSVHKILSLAWLPITPPRYFLFSLTIEKIYKFFCCLWISLL